ncbi:hypothetical protein KKC74_10280 [bacterium]|nr:hypothetical protein [bacterium]MBU1065176.1 hypothetical protein [bacterium]MBU1873733.1 hypothetical protein [bacterium]
MSVLIKLTNDLPPIIQGAIGSALFWILLQLVGSIAKKISDLTGAYKEQTKKEEGLREYIYRKYTSRGGLAYYPQGYLFTFSEVLKYFLQGFIFVCISLLFRDYFSIATSICLVGAIYYFVKALIWLFPSVSWNTLSNEEHWQKVKELEEKLFGKVSNDTLEFLDKIKNQVESS